MGRAAGRLCRSGRTICRCRKCIEASKPTGSTGRSGPNTRFIFSSHATVSAASIAPQSRVACNSLLTTSPALARAAAAQQAAAGRKTNILVIFGDDVGQSNISAYTHGLVGYQPSNIDQIAKDRDDVHRLLRREQLHGGSVDVHHRPIGLANRHVKVGMPGAPVGLQARDVTIAQALKPLGYATGQFGKNHLGDRDEFLPTNHGFDEFFGNLYHLNAEEEPERPYWPKDDPQCTRPASRRRVSRSTRSRRRSRRKSKG
jgi:hypothetical protein